MTLLQSGVSSPWCKSELDLVHRDMARSEEGLVSNRIWDLTSPSVSPAVRSLAWLPALEDPVCVVMAQNTKRLLYLAKRKQVLRSIEAHRGRRIPFFRSAM
ncbi:uncharacterized protein PHALS_10314 [Plasmopara halstedii]|uniref:Uncharacterized protein n=1 Tax=Plasmopara halstedii TaxID=4781 RepID=A0A0P1AHE4_PLAHL|nr:uncharacterized protein PHALS_10314 [Plasmopara halstedii]CEG40095.1 hypothetical protein PHALS_10314 [Plasmopara halstedii]|eukprot:XP_024576464.1 hypothetical protein PHALS_10314 [Plasmopara halstedii]